MPAVFKFHQRLPAKLALTAASIMMTTIFGSTQDVLSASNQHRTTPQIFSNLSLNAAREQAHNEGKLLLIDFTANRCEPCEMMDKNVWSAPDVEDFLKHYVVAVQVDVDEQKDLAKPFNVHVWPAMAVCLPYEPTVVFDQVYGYKDSKRVIAWLKAAQDGKKIDITRDGFGRNGPFNFIVVLLFAALMIFVIGNRRKNKKKGFLNEVPSWKMNQKREQKKHQPKDRK